MSYIEPIRWPFSGTKQEVEVLILLVHVPTVGLCYECQQAACDFYRVDSWTLTVLLVQPLHVQKDPAVS